jgi:hypothetical protein
MTEVSMMLDDAVYLTAEQATKLVAELQYALAESTDHQTTWPVTLVEGRSMFTIHVRPPK